LLPADERLYKRLRKLLAQFGGAIGRSNSADLPGLGQYQGGLSLFRHERVNEADILAGHFQSMRERIPATWGLILAVHDTTEFTYNGTAPG
jgi:hypothetical protein